MSQVMFAREAESSFYVQMCFNEWTPFIALLSACRCCLPQLSIFFTNRQLWNSVLYVDHEIYYRWEEQILDVSFIEFFMLFV